MEQIWSIMKSMSFLSDSRINEEWHSGLGVLEGPFTNEIIPRMKNEVPFDLVGS
jgi:hypothetical protein